MHSGFLRVGVALLGVLYGGAAVAHPGHGNGVVAGMMHPLLGLDHLAVMLLVGIWAAQQQARTRWVAPAGFAAAMALFAGMAVFFPGLPFAESGVAASIILSGLLLVFAVTAKPAAAVCIVGLLAMCHGYVHGIEMPASLGPWQYGAGFLLSTLFLQGLGFVLGTRLQQYKWALPASGLAAVIGGGWALTGALA